MPDTCPIEQSDTGRLPGARPKLRGMTEVFASSLFGAHVTKTNALESLVIASFVRGLSAPDGWRGLTMTPDGLRLLQDRRRSLLEPPASSGHAPPPRPKTASSPRLSAQSPSLPAMATFVLIHGAGDAGWYWHLTEAELQARGHHTIAPDLPCDNDTASLNDYAGTVIDAARGQQDLVIVGQSYGAFTATLVAAQLPVRLLVLLAGMIPAPAESPGEWWANTGYRHAVQEQAGLDGGKTGHDDPLISFYNGLPRPLAEEALRRGGRGESPTVWNTPWPLDAWPKVPTKFILCKEDQFFPAAYMRRLAWQRLGTVPDEVPGCHCAALSHPKELTDLLVSYLD